MGKIEIRNGSNNYLSQHHPTDAQHVLVDVCLNHCFNATTTKHRFICGTD